MHPTRYRDKEWGSLDIPNNSNVTKGYKLYNKKTWKLIMSRDVQFLKNKTCIWTLTQSKEKEVVIEEDFVEDNENQKDSITNIYISNTLWTRIFHVRHHSMARLVFIGEKLVLEKTESPLILFYFKRENKTRRKTLKSDSIVFGKACI